MGDGVDVCVCVCEYAYLHVCICTCAQVCVCCLGARGCVWMYAGVYGCVRGYVNLLAFGRSPHPAWVVGQRFLGCISEYIGCLSEASCTALGDLLGAYWKPLGASLGRLT